MSTPVLRFGLIYLFLGELIFEPYVALCWQDLVWFWRLSWNWSLPYNRNWLVPLQLPTLFYCLFLTLISSLTHEKRTHVVAWPSSKWEKHIHDASGVLYSIFQWVWLNNSWITWDISLSLGLHGPYGAGRSLQSCSAFLANRDPKLLCDQCLTVHAPPRAAAPKYWAKCNPQLWHWIWTKNKQTATTNSPCS